MLDQFKRLLEPLSNRINSLITVGVLRRIDPGSTQHCQVELLEGELRDKVPHHLPYGHASVPLDGAEPLVVFLRGDKSGGIVIQVSDPRHQPTLKKGESALHDDQDQTVHISRDGIVIRSSMKVTIDTPAAEFTGDVTIAGDTKMEGGLQVPNMNTDDAIVSAKSVKDHMSTHG